MENIQYIAEVYLGPTKPVLIEYFAKYLTAKSCKLFSQKSSII